MKPPFKSLAELDRTIHDPSRLAILTALSSCRSADFLYLQRLTGLSKGNLSSHLAKLEDAGLVHTRREGRYKFHELDTTPLREINERWTTTGGRSPK